MVVFVHFFVLQKYFNGGECNLTISDIKKTRVSEEVFQEMKQMILEQQWKPGSKLPSEQALCDIFGVSRVTIRSALHRLNALDLVETYLGDGSYVKKLESGVSINNLIPTVYFEDDFETILEFRMEVESGACAIAARKATKKDIAGLKRILKRIEALQDDLESLALMDLKFHYTIAKISRNSMIIKTYEIISDVYASHMKRMVGAMGGNLGMYYHDRIVAAIEAHDAEAAREIMYKHIYSNLEFIHAYKQNELPEK